MVAHLHVVYMQAESPKNSYYGYQVSKSSQE